MKHFFRVVFVLVVLSAAVTIGVYLWLGGGRPSRSGSFRLAGLDAPVEVRWDRWGVPSIRADSEADLAAALGWIHANDRITQMELGRRAVFGRLSEVLGEATVETDVYFRRHRMGATAEALWQGLAPVTREWLDAYAHGVNAWLETRGDDLPPELRLLGVRPEPWEGVHSIAFALLMARDLSFWNDRPEEARFGWLRAFGPEATAELLGDPGLHVPEAILELARGEAPRPRQAAEPDLSSPGSNNWALGPSRTASGKALVANDPHLGLFLPSIWYQVVLRSPTYEAAGMTLPGAPGVILGRGAGIAWAMTNVMLDDHDVFFEQLDDDGKRVRRGDGWLEITEEEQTIGIRGGGSQTVTVRSTDLGPLLEADPERGLPARSLAWTAYHGGDPLRALRDLALAKTPEEALLAVEPYVAPAQNLVAAFATGELLYTAIGRVPDRRLGDGRLPSPAWDPAYGWDGLRPRHTNPTVLDPEDAVLVTANHDIRPPGYELPLPSDFFPGHRAARIRQRLEAGTSWDFEDMAELQTDAVSLYAQELIAAALGNYEGDAREAFGRLALWNGEMTRRGVPVLYALFQRALIEAVFGDEAELAELDPSVHRDALWRVMRGDASERWFDDVRTEAVETRHEVLSAALARAWREAHERWGDETSDWDYGELHRLTLRHRLDALPVLGRWLRRGPFELPGSATTVLAFGFRWRGEHMEVTYGPSMRFITDWSQPDVNFAILPGGQSGHLTDPHYDDQVGAFLTGRLHLVPYSEERAERLAVTRLELLP